MPFGERSRLKHTIISLNDFDNQSSEGRPRAHSAPAVTTLGIHPVRWKKKGVNGMEIEFHPMLNGHAKTGSKNHNNNTNFVHRNCRHSRRNNHTQQRARRMSVSARMNRHRETLEMKCCKIHVLLVLMQICLGCSITGLGIYMAAWTPTLETRETPYWAGIPLFLAGIFGVIYFCVTDNYSYHGSIKSFAIKAACVTLSAISVFVCIVAAVFPGIHGSRISQYQSPCIRTENDICICSESEEDPTGRVYKYYSLPDCKAETFTSIKDNLILQCAFNSIGCGVSMWLVVLLWQSRYQDFHSGLRFYSYSANAPSNPWIDPTSPPYLNATPETPSFDRKLSQKRLLARQKTEEEEGGDPSQNNNRIEHAKERTEPNNIDIEQGQTSTLLVRPTINNGGIQS